MRTLPMWGALLLHSLASLAQNNVTVEENDPSLVYTPPSSSWNRSFNPRPSPPDGAANNSYYHGGGYLSYDFKGASITLTFNGSYIAYYSDMFTNHGTMEIELDNVRTTISTYTSLQYGMPQVKLFEAHVDPNTPDHTIKLSNAENKTMGLDYFLYTAASPVIPVPHSPSSTADPSDPVSTSTVTAKSANPPLAGPTIVGITIAAAFVAVVLAIGGAVCLRRRHRTGIVASSREEVWHPIPPSVSGATTTPYLLAPMGETSVPGTPIDKRPKSEAFNAFVRSSIAPHRIGNDSSAGNLGAPPSYSEAR